MPDQTLPILLSVVIVSAISLVGAITLLGRGRVKEMLPLLVALAAGAMMGDTFLHLLPHAVEEAGGFTPAITWGVLGGLLGFFLVEGVLHWHHHGEDVHEHGPGGVHHIGWMNLLGDCLHNLIDGMLIAGAWFVSPEVGIATTVAVLLHEIPQEFGDFGVLLHAGFTPGRAILFNLISALFAVVGAVVVLIIGPGTHLAQTLVPIAAGGFLYIACADLVPEIRKRARGWQLVSTFGVLLLGVALMAFVHEFEGDSHDHGHGESHGPAEPGHDHDHDHEDGEDGEDGHDPK